MRRVSPTRCSVGKTQSGISRPSPCRTAKSRALSAEADLLYRDKGDGKLSERHIREYDNITGVVNLDDLASAVRQVRIAELPSYLTP